MLPPRLRSLARWRVPIALFLLAGVFEARYVAQHLPTTQALLWGGVMLVSFVGWGSVVNWLVWPGRVADVGLRAIWGVSVTLFLGGILCALHWARTPVVCVQVAIGLVLAAAFSVIHARAPSVRTGRVLLAAPGLGLVLLAGYAAALIWFYGNLGNAKYNESDDYILYWVLSKKVLATGTMYEPFAGRRLLSFGGQDYLHAIYLVGAPLCFIHGLDRGVFMILTVALVAGEFTTEGLKTRYVAPLGLALFTLFWLPEVLQNSGSLYSGIAALLGVWRTLRWRETGTTDPAAWSLEPRRLVLLGLLAVTCIILRSSNLIPVAAFLGLAIVLDYVRARRPIRSLTALGSALGVLALSTALALLPWSILMWQSGGTLLFPVSQGNLTQGFEHLHKVEEMGEFADTLVANVFHDRTLASFGIVALAAMIPTRGRGANDGFAFTVASLAGLVAVSTVGAWWGPEHLPRYYFSYFAATAIAVVASAKSALGRHSPSQIARLAVVAAAVAAQVVDGRVAAREVYTTLVGNMTRVWKEPQRVISEFSAGDAAYEDLQAQVPEGARLAVAVLEPFRFDFRRNPIDSLDTPMGGMGPAPGFPTFKGPEALASYLLSHDVRYLAFTDFGQFSFPYGRAHWEDLLRTDKGYLRPAARYNLDVMASIEALAKTRQVMHRSGLMTLIDLGAQR